VQPLQPAVSALGLKPSIIVTLSAGGIGRRAAEAVGEVQAVVGGRRGPSPLVKITVAAILGPSIRHSVTTRMAVGQLAIFRSVTATFGNASKIASCADFIGIVTE
jgi:hypothetical protein